MTDRDFLLCALNLLLDEEERLARLCPACRQAAQSCCPGCGTPLEDTAQGCNPAFDPGRFEQLSRGETDGVDAVSP